MRGIGGRHAVGPVFPGRRRLGGHGGWPRCWARPAPCNRKRRRFSLGMRRISGLSVRRGPRRFPRARMVRGVVCNPYMGRRRDSSSFRRAKKVAPVVVSPRIASWPGLPLSPVNRLQSSPPPSTVIRGLVPGIGTGTRFPVVPFRIPGTSPGMTVFLEGGRAVSYRRRPSRPISVSYRVWFLRLV